MDRMEEKNSNNELFIINTNNNSNDNSNNNNNDFPLIINNNNIKREIDIDFEDERFDTKDENYHSKCGEIFVSKDKEFTFHCSICNENYLNFNYFSEHVLYDQNHANQLVFLNNCTNGNNNNFIIPSLPLLPPPSSSVILSNNPFHDDYHPVDCENIVKTELTDDEKFYDYCDEKSSSSNIFGDEMLEVISAPPAGYYQNNNEFNEQQSDFSELNEEEPIILANLREEIMQDEISNNSTGNNHYGGFHKCNFCDKEFSRAWNLNIHLKRCKLNINKIEYHQQSSQLHNNKLDSSAFKIMCPICKMSFQREVNLNFHLKKYHKNTVWAHTEESLLRCDLCNTSFKRREYLRKHIKRHMAKHRKQQYLPSNPISSDNNKLLECKDCNLKFDEEYQLFAHQSTHLYTDSTETNEWDIKFSSNNIDSSTPTTNYYSNDNNIPFEFVDNSTFIETNQQYKCERCDRTYNNEESLKLHNCINIFDRPHQCLTCDRSFMYQSYLKRHMKRCSNRNSINEKNNKNNFNFIDDYDNESEIRYNENLMKNNFSSIPSIDDDNEQLSIIPSNKSTINSPLKRRGSGNLLLKLFKCKFCKKVFRSKINLQNHLSIHLKSQNKSIITENMTTINKLQLTPPSLKCKICGRKFKQKISLMIHERGHSDDKPYECNLCQLKFYTKGYLNFHQKSIHKICSTTISKSFNCEICNGKFLSKSLLHIHINKIHRKNDENTSEELKQSTSNPNEYKKFGENLSNTTNDTTKYKCRFCPKLINRRTNLIIHERIHLGQRPHSCELCNKTFPSISYVKLHKKNAHNITVPRIQYQCQYCPKITTTEYFLTLHINNSHRDECPHECNSCLKRFAIIDDLNIHCKIEHSSLNDTENIKSINEQQQNEENNLKCNYCSKSFNNLYNFNVHLRNHHTGERSYYCNLCDKKFSCAPYLWKHNQFWHKEEKTTTNFSKILPINKKNISPQKDLTTTTTSTTSVKSKSIKEDYYLYVHACEICGKKFKKIAYLKMHEAKHTDTYKCEICGKRCSSSHNLNVHQQIHAHDKGDSTNANKIDKNETTATPTKKETSDNLLKAVNSCIKNKMSIIGASKFYNLDFRMLYKNVAIKRRELNEKSNINNVKVQETFNIDIKPFDINEEKSLIPEIVQTNKFLTNRKRIYKKRSSAALENSKFRQEGTKEREALIKAVRLYEAGELSQAQVAKSFNISVASLCRHMSTVPRIGEINEILTSNEINNSIVEINNKKSIKVPTDISTWYTENTSNSDNEDMEIGEVIKAEECLDNLNTSDNIDFKEIRKILSQPSKSLSTINVDNNLQQFNEEKSNTDFEIVTDYTKSVHDIDEYKYDNQQNSVRRHPIEKILQAVEEYKKGGVSQSKICETYKISLSTLKRHLKKSKKTIYPHINIMYQQPMIRPNQSNNQTTIHNQNEINPSSDNLIKAVNSCLKNKMSIIGASKFYNLDFKMLYKNVAIKRRELIEKANENNLLQQKNDNPILNYEQKLFNDNDKLSSSNIKSSSTTSTTIFSNAQTSAMKLLYNRKRKFKKRVPHALGNSKFRQEGTAERAQLIKAVRLYRSGEMSQVKAAKFCNISLATLCRHMNSVSKYDETNEYQFQDRNNDIMPLNINKDYNWSNTCNQINYINENFDNIQQQQQQISENFAEYFDNTNKISNINLNENLQQQQLLPSTFSTPTIEYNKDDDGIIGGQFDSSFPPIHEFSEHSAFFSSDDQFPIKTDNKTTTDDVLQRCSMEKITKAIEEYKRGGVSQSKICKMYRMSLSTLQRYLKDEQKSILTNYSKPTTVTTIIPPPPISSTTSSSTISTTINHQEKMFNDDNLLKAILAVRNDGLSHFDAANAHNVSVSALYLSLTRNEDNQ